MVTIVRRSCSLTLGRSSGKLRITPNQLKIIAAAIIGDMLEFFDDFLIGFVLAFIIRPWHLTFGQSAIILLSSGVGPVLGAFVWGRIADVIGRRRVFLATVINFSVATGILAFTPDHGWIFLSIFRFFVGFGIGALYCVDLHLLQEFVPTRRRGFIGGIVTAFVPFGVMIASALGAFLAPEIGWRGLFLVGLAPALFTLVIRAWVPESPHWLIAQGRPEEARRSLAWAVQVAPQSLPLPTASETPQRSRWSDLFRYPAASPSPGWQASAPRPRNMASSCGDRPCSCCSSASRRPMLPICSSTSPPPASSAVSRSLCSRR